MMAVQLYFPDQLPVWLAYPACIFSSTNWPLEKWRPPLKLAWRAEFISGMEQVKKLDVENGTLGT